MTSTAQRDAAGPAAARRAMIDSQLRPSGVNEAWVLEAVARVPREDFVPATMREAAYIDRAIDLGGGRALAAPLVHARMLAEAAPSRSDRALLIGDGGGYLAALLRPLVGAMTALAPAAFAPGGPGLLHPDAGLHTLAVIDGAVERLPEPLVATLADGARVVTGLVARGVTRLAVGCKAAGAVSLLALAEIGIPVLAEFAEPKRWSF